jgi:hypothetical protein
MTCESNLRTRWLARNIPSLAPATPSPQQLDMPQAGLVLLAVGYIYQPSSGWGSQWCEIALRIIGGDLLMRDGEPIPGPMLVDDRGPRPLTEPIPLTGKEWVEVSIVNDTSGTLRAKVCLEYLPMSDDELKRYKADPVYRLEIKEELALSWARRR